MAAEPTTVTVRMHQVAFGDCFLLSIGYSDGTERHVLIDFGQKSRVKRRAGQPEMGPKSLTRVAEAIRDRVGDAGLEAIVVTHRHEDHLSGFGVDDAAAIIEGLKPRLVIRSWTEDPAAPADASRQAAPSHRYIAGLQAANGVATLLAENPFEAARTAAGTDLRSLAAAEIPNAAAIKALDHLGTLAGARKPEYLNAPGPTDPPTATALADLLPGVQVDILGPPCPEVWPDIANQREEDPDYWIAMIRSLSIPWWSGPTAAAAGGDDGGSDDDDPGAITTSQVEELVEAGPARWLVERLRKQQVSSVLRIVRWLDRSLNNTSVVLLFTVAGKRLLFPGDAQIENWLYALQAHPEHARIWDDLGKLDLYKVGHHGSRNATPKRVYRHWRDTPRGAPLLAVMSTMKDVYGESDGTKVPNGRLVTALHRKQFTTLSTEDFKPGELFRDMKVTA
jgi:beta-lactamase superfamily II metal-dependent hydrolase